MHTCPQRRQPWPPPKKTSTNPDLQLGRSGQAIPGKESTGVGECIRLRIFAPSKNANVEILICNLSPVLHQTSRAGRLARKRIGSPTCVVTEKFWGWWFQCDDDQGKYYFLPRFLQCIVKRYFTYHRLRCEGAQFPMDSFLQGPSM